MYIEVIKNCPYSMILIAATPSDPKYSMRTILNSIVVIPVDIFATISDEPFIHDFTKKSKSNLGLTK